MLALLVLPILISFGIYIFCPDTYAYAGFSGVLHGLYFLFAVQSLKIKKDRMIAMVLIVALIIKLVWEMKFTAASVTAKLIGSPILIEAHQLGVISALVLLVVTRLLIKLTK